MKKSTSSALLAAGFVTILAATALNAAPGHKPRPVPPGQNKLLCFDGTSDGGYGGVCSQKSNGVKSPATLNNTDTNAAGDYAGAYYATTTMAGQPLGSVTELSYTYSGTTVPGPGDLSLNVPINLTGGSATDNYLFIDAAYCPGVKGSVNVITDSACGMYYAGATFYPNWAAVVAAYPAAKVATDSVPFIIAERTPSEGPALWTVSNIILGKTGK